MLKLLFSSVILLSLLFFTLDRLESLPTDTNNFLKIGGSFILVFSLFIIVRYFILLFFSMLNLHKNKTILEKRSITFKNRPFISIIVPCYNEELMLKASLESLKELDYPNYEIIVVDDGSSDDTYLIAKNMEFDTKNMALKAYTKKNGGKANALNFGIKRAKGEFVVCVDADSKLSKNSLDKMVEHFEDKQIAAVAGSVYVVNADSFVTKLQALEYIQGLNLVRNAQGYHKLVNIIPGPIGMFRKEAIQDIGLYKDDTFAEDCDLTLRLITAGYKIEYEIDAISYTEAPDNLNQLLKQRYRWNRGVLQAVLKHKSKLIPFTAPFSITFVLWNMLFESILWPIASTFANFFIVYMGIVSGYGELFIYWWIIFTILDLSASIYCVSVTKEKLSLVLYSFYYRIYFVNVMNIVKVLATIEEFMGVKMTWGVLQRKGTI